MNTKMYAVVFETAPSSNWSAYVPDLPGCVSTGKTLEETEVNIREAIAFHLDGITEDGLPIPEATSFARMIEVA
jgi:predicted RNase H-like HicB family nuclease